MRWWSPDESGDRRDRAAPVRGSGRLLAAALVLGGGVLAVVAAVAGDDAGAWFAAIASGVAAVVVFAAPRRGRAANAWLLIALGMTCWTGAQVATASEWGAGMAEVPLPSPVDVPRLGGLVLIAIGLGMMAHRRSTRPDWMARLDTAIAGVGAAVVITVFLLPQLAERNDLEPGSADQLTALAAAAVVVLLFTVSVRLAITGAVRLASGRFLLAGTLGLLIGESLWRMGQLELWDVGAASVIAALFTVAAALVAAAAVHPSACRIGEVEHRPVHHLPRPRLALLAVAACAGPLCALVLYVLDEPVDGLVVGVDTAIVLILILLRLELVLREGHAQAARELIVRTTVAAISASRDIDAILGAVVNGACELAGPELRFCLFATENERGARNIQEVVSPGEAVDPLTSGLMDLLEMVQVDDDRPVRVLSSSGDEVVIAAIPCRLAPRCLILVAGLDALPYELDGSLHMLASQAALAIDAAVQGAELITKRKEVRLQQIVRHASDAIVIIGRDRKVRYQSPSVVRVLGYLPIDLEGAAIERLAHPDAWTHFAGFLDQLATSPHEAVRTTDIQLIRADDSVIQTEVVGTNLLDNIDVRGMVLTVRDVSGRRMLEDQLRHQAFHDALTGLANRALFIDRVEHALERVRRSDSSTPAVAFIDLDDFKNVNDTLGHGAGDEMLCAVAERLRRCLRAGDTPARLGGDEFAVLVEDAPDPSQIIEVAERVLEALREPVTVEGVAVHIGGSIGIATRLGPHTSSADLLRNADLAMYTAKQNGKGRIEIFEPDMGHRAVDRQALRLNLESAINEGGIDVAYQPIVELATGAVVGFEALARWEHPERGPVSPVEFIPMAEDGGLIVALGRTVLQQACRQLATWQTSGDRARWRIGVNLSARQLLAPDLITMIRQITDEAGLAPSAVSIEITEAVLLSDTERVLQRLQRLKDLGVAIAIDDFGTGYSSIGYLQRVPFDVLKIDRTFVAALQVEAPGSTLVRTILDLAHTLGRPVVAEGVEQQVELDGLRLLGCEFGQGYLLGAPADAATVQRVIDNLPESA